MNSIFSILLLDLMQRIKTQIPEIKWIDQDLGQLEDYGDRPPVLFPCVLIDIDSVDFSNKGELTQIGEGSILFRLAFQPWSNSNAATPENYRKKALEYYELEHRLHQCLQGYGTAQYGPLIRQSANSEQRNDPLRVRQLRYSVVLEDDSVLKDVVAIPEENEVTLTVRPQ